MPNTEYRIRLLSSAERDFNEIIDFVLAENVSAALSIAEKIESTLLLLKKNPRLGCIPNDEELRRFGYRYLVVLDYLVFYKIEGKIIFVYRILHGARNYKSLL
ncbi:MAG: type II toxin-antitoxin system RelE/ParE family toxin [Bacteroidetes bacterium]|nr:type II toxin-antitoxin system RelE/ParE family toxin [Bacteroidota bacterium]